MINKYIKNNKIQTIGFVNLCRKTIILFIAKIYNCFLGFLPESQKIYSSHPIVQEIERRAYVATDISAHLATLFTESLESKAKLIVELGTRGGESTFVLEKVADMIGAKLVCVDLNDSSKACSPKTNFVQSDDISFGKRFKEWCSEKNLPTVIDLLFIDTSHEYVHTKSEIDTYFPLLSDTATVVFHDTNMRYIYKKSDGSLDYGYCENIKGDVMRAIEEHLGKSYDSSHDFVDYFDGWLIKHRSISNGFTVMKKIKI
jgi:predicted O-methyltransferase YrrM